MCVGLQLYQEVLKIQRALSSITNLWMWMSYITDAEFHLFDNVYYWQYFYHVMYREKYLLYLYCLSKGHLACLNTKC